jgi:putative oxidoreductase
MRHLISGSWAVKWSDPALLFLRVATGLVFFMHGWQKWEGGVDQTAAFLMGLQFPAPDLFAMLLIAAEVLGGAALILGAFTRLAAKISAIVAAVALLTVHVDNGFFLSNGGYEFILLILAACVALVVHGGGKWSLDAKVIKM